MSIGQAECHLDHHFPHSNIVVYLSDSSGDTVAFKDKKGEEVIDRFTPQEDKVITWGGTYHTAESPQGTLRRTIVATYLDKNGNGL